MPLTDDSPAENHEPDEDREKQSRYSQSLFEQACRKNMSLWRTHSGPQEREVPQSTDDEPEEDDGLDIDDDYYEPPSEIGNCRFYVM